MANIIRYVLRGDTGENWQRVNPVLLYNEVAYDRTANRLKFGDGATPWKDLPYVAPDVINDLTTGGTDKALSAEQGKALKALIDAKPSGSSYTHPSYTSRTGVPTSNQSPSFGGSFTVSQVTSDGTGHVSGMTSRTITIPGTEATTSAKGLMSASDKTKLNNIAAGATAVSVVNNLTSTSTTAALSAAQGKALNDSKLAANKVTSESWTFTLSSGSTVTKKVTLWT